jgi:hypothetical protein
MSSCELPPATVDRVLKLVRMLSNSNANEAGAAAVALNRTLGDAGLDIYDFAGVVKQGFQTSPITKAIPEVDNDWREVVAFCAARAHLLSQRDRSLVETLSRWRGGHPSPKQTQWLRDIVWRLCNNRRR